MPGARLQGVIAMTVVAALQSGSGDEEGLVITWQTVVGGVVLVAALVASRAIRRRGMGR